MGETSIFLRYLLLFKRATNFSCSLWLQEGCVSLDISLLARFIFFFFVVMTSLESPLDFNLDLSWRHVNPFNIVTWLFKNLAKNDVFKVNFWFCVRPNLQLCLTTGWTYLQHEHYDLIIPRLGKLRELQNNGNFANTDT